MNCQVRTWITGEKASGAMSAERKNRRQRGRERVISSSAAASGTTHIAVTATTKMTPMWTNDSHHRLSCHMAR